MDVLEHVVEDDEVEGAILERQLVHGGDPQVGVRHHRAGDLDRLGADIHAAEPLERAALGRPREEAAGSATGVEERPVQPPAEQRARELPHPHRPPVPALQLAEPPVVVGWDVFHEARPSTTEKRGARLLATELR